ncbi:MAG: efflux RND transporter periplasmic adaptor subunit [Gammaproteobacteria bacterium]
MSPKVTVVVTGIAAALSLAQPAAAQESPPHPVAVSVVESAAITPTMPIAGMVYSRNDVQITLGVDGQLEHVSEPGTLLETGDVIASIDTGPLELQLAEQRAQADRARAQLTFLNAQLERQRSLLSTQSTSVNQLEQTQADRDVAASDLRIAELRIEQTEDQIARGTIRAQFDGVVIERLRRAGEDVARGTVLARVTDTENLEVRVPVPLQYAGRVQTGDALKIFGYESEHAGEVRSLVPSADVRSQTLELRIDLPRSAGEEWAIGELVSVAVPLQGKESSLAVHRDALILRQDGTYVFRIDEQNRAERILVETGDSSGDLVAIAGPPAASLAEGDRVVVRGAETLSDGMTVSVLEAAASGARAAHTSGS